jgi:translation initiation factor IF-3
MQLAEDVAEFGVVEQRPNLDGRNMTMLLAPLKPKEEATGETPAASAGEASAEAAEAAPAEAAEAAPAETAGDTPAEVAAETPEAPAETPAPPEETPEPPAAAAGENSSAA